ncbi:hypothetical protein D3C78_592840 [compost metagenome]
MSGAQGMAAVPAAATPLLRVCTRNHHSGTLADWLPRVSKVTPQAVSPGCATLMPQRALAVASSFMLVRLTGSMGTQANSRTT